MPQDSIYLAILRVMVGTVIFGGVLVIAGEQVYNNPQISRFGLVLVIIGGFVYVFFRWLGNREMKRREEDNDDRN